MPELEIINGPVAVWWGPVGEAYPAIGAAPAGNWVQIGTSGAHNYFEDGVSVKSDKTLEFFRALGSGYPRKAWITQADNFVSVKVADMTLAQLRLALNQNAVTSDSGFDYISLDIGLDVSEIALLVVASGKSPLIAAGNLHFQFDKVVEAGSRDWLFVKGDAVGTELNFQIIYSDGATYPVGRILAADA